MLFFSFKKGLNGQNHSSDSHHHMKILPANFPISLMGRYPRVSPGVENIGEDLNQYMGGDWGEGVNSSNVIFQGF